MQAASRRHVPDRCPGAVRVHAAADGGLARVRLPGGRLTAAQLGALRSAAAALGDPVLELTSRGNVQVRALREGAPQRLAALLHEAGLLPSETHERVRNIVASPLSGLDGAGPDVRALVREFDAALCATPELAGLPGRFLVTIDDGRGDVTGLGGDVGLHGGRLLLAQAPTPLRGGAGLLVRAALAFLAERAGQGSAAWRLAELDGGPARVAARLGTETGPRLAGAPRPTPVGLTRQVDGAAAIVVVAPLGLLTPDQAEALGGVAEEMIVTPWRTVVLPHVPMDEADLAVERLAAAGLVADPASPWAGVTACAGRPGCAKALADVRADARAAVVADAAPQALPVHWVGCERRCGAPRGRHVEMLATGSGYRRVES
ncbi:precorrin-3B synthase [Dactylosporangium roseum]|uniref:precorrin-3B synthase n=1 Tax=Dactylosporangium roseum TaxID=47989 RepID=UPI0021B48209|nr:precorrin-3B synthase [Dactylosporangium roseum]